MLRSEPASLADPSAPAPPASAPSSAVPRDDAEAAQPATACRNCGAVLGGPYCARCGQRDAPVDPSLRELAGDTWDALVDVDGRLLSSLRLLLTRPGALTLRYLEGRRASYVAPIRLYLACSVAFFLLQAALPERDRAVQVGSTGQVTGVPDALSDDDVRAGVAGPEWSRRIQRGMRRADADGSAFSARVLDRAPQVVFVLVPVQTLLLAAAYRGRRRRLPAHLVFALHTHAFFFVALGVVGVLAWLGPAALHEFGDPVAICAAIGYALLALHRVYGGRWWATIARGAMIMLGYVVGAALAMGALVLLTFYQMGERRTSAGAPPVTRPSPAAAP